MAVDPKGALAHDLQRLASVVRDALDLAEACRPDAEGAIDSIAEALGILSPACEKVAQAAAWKADATLPDTTPRELLLQQSEPAEGSPEALDEIRKTTQLYFEVAVDNFPFDGEVRWFENGLGVVGPGDDPVVYQTPMNRVEEMIVPREAPKMPRIRNRPVRPQA